MPVGRDFNGQHLQECTCQGGMHALLLPFPTRCQCGNEKGIHLQLSNGMDIVARLALGDFSMPDFDGFPIQAQVAELRSEIRGV